MVWVNFFFELQVFISFPGESLTICVNPIIEYFLCQNFIFILFFQVF